VKHIQDRRNQMATTFYVRPIDDGAGRQNVTVDGVIVRQSLVARQGYYTGDGNPEIVGKPVVALRGMGFKKVKGPQSFNSMTNKWQSVDGTYDLVDAYGDYE